MEGLANWATRRSLLLQRRFALAREQPKAMKSRMTRECYVRICEGLGVKFPGATRPTGTPDRRRRVLDECLGDLAPADVATQLNAVCAEFSRSYRNPVLSEVGTIMECLV